MKVLFEAPKRTRLSRYYCGITIMNRSLWWVPSLRKWMEHPPKNHDYSNFCDCRTTKAFMRHLRKHKNELKDCKIVLVNRFVGHDVTAFVEPED
jgi:hypothetical protein